MKNQHGYTLILVLLIIIIIGIMTPPLVNSVLSSSKQVQITEESIQKDKLLDMGKVYARNTIISEVNELNSSQQYNVDEAIEELKNNLYSHNPEFNGQLVNSYYHLEYEYENIIATEDNILEVPYTITAYLASPSNPAELIGQRESVREIYKLQLAGGSPPTQEDFYDETQFPNQFDERHYSDIDVIEGNTNFIDTVQLKQGDTLSVNGDVALQSGAQMNNNGDLYISGNFYAVGGKIFLNKDSTIIIGRDAWFYQSATDQIQNEGMMCIQGRVMGDTPPPATQVNSCDEAVGRTGIFYVGQIFTDPDSGSGFWSPIGPS